MMKRQSFKNKITDIIKNDTEDIEIDIDREAQAYARADKIKECRELTIDRFGAVAWWMALDTTKAKKNPGKKTINDVVKIIEEDAKEMWGDDAKKELANAGFKSARDVEDLMTIAVEHGLVQTDGEPDKLTATLFGE